MRSTRILATPLLIGYATLALALAAGPAAAQVDKEVTVGVTATCPYGLSACYAGAREALGRLEGVKSVAMSPDSRNSTVKVVLAEDTLPDPDQWAKTFKEMVDQVYIFRGIEVTVSGTVEQKDDHLVLNVPSVKQPIRLVPLQRSIQWDAKARGPRTPEAEERQAYRQLIDQVKTAESGGAPIRVTGRLEKLDRGYVLEVRKFSRGKS